MKKLIIIALLMSIITGFAVYYYARNLENNLRVKTVPVAVAVKAIPKDTVIKAEMVTIKQFPKELVNGLVAKSIDEVKGRIAKQDIEANEQIFNNRLSDAGNKGEGLSYTIKDGYRALTFKTDEITGLAGRLSKGDFVDIIAMIPNKSVASGTESRMVLENVEVLELGIEQTVTDEKSSGTYSSVTLLVKAEDVLKVNSAISEGKCTLVLRSVLDKNIINPAPYTPY
ncbi:MAG: Flp pilus assembly protein CpaB [Bacillota bacterium]|nr:Flp pilus assembly protein CpaB [Bacillota bacterium]